MGNGVWREAPRPNHFLRDGGKCTLIFRKALPCPMSSGMFLTSKSFFYSTQSSSRTSRSLPCTYHKQGTAALSFAIFSIAKAVRQNQTGQRHRAGIRGQSFRKSTNPLGTSKS